MSRAPNVVVVVCDQLRPFELGCHGGPVPTPNIDRLSAGGVRFETAVTNNPVCMPARTCLLTGQHSRTCMGAMGNEGGDPPVEHRVHCPDETLPEMLRRTGWRTGLIGKWHVEPSPRALGFESSVYPLAIHRYHGQRYFTSGVLGEPVMEFGPDYEAALVGQFVRQPRDDPFFLFYNISPPHEPIGPGEVPERYLRQFGRDDVKLRPNVWKDGYLAENAWWFKTYLIWDHFWRTAQSDPWRPCPVGYPQAGIGPLPSDTLPDGFDLRDLTARYYAAIAWVDDLVGRLVRALDDSGNLDNTIIIFASDHGDNLGSHHLFNKDCLFEESIRIPLIFHWPNRLSPSVNRSQIAQIIDIYPTLAGLLGLEIPGFVAGRNLTPLLEGTRESLDENWAFIETDAMHYGSPVAGLRTPDHTFGALMPVLEPGSALTGDWGLYDLEADPCQFENLAENPAHRACRDALRATLDSLHAEICWLSEKRMGKISEH